MGTKGTTFIKITNKMIYDEIVELKDHVKETNGKVKLNRWIATTSISIGLLMIPLVVAALNA